MDLRRKQYGDIWKESMCEFNSYIDDGIPDFVELKQELLERKFSASGSIDDKYRLMNYWVEEGLLDESRTNKKGWRKFNLLEVIWVSIICKLKRFGLSNEKIRIAKESLFTYEDFIYHIVVALFSKLRVNIIVFDDGLLLLRDDYSFTLDKQHLPKDYILLDLNSILKELYGDQYENEYGRNPISIPINSNYVSLITTIMQGDCENIVIHFKDKKAQRIEVSTLVPTEQRIVDAMRDFDYGKIEILKKEGKIAQIKKDIQIKL